MEMSEQKNLKKRTKRANMCEMITVMDLIKPINIHRPRLEEYNDKLKEGYYGKSDLSCLGGFHCHRQYLNKSWYSCCCNCFS